MGDQDDLDMAIQGVKQQARRQRLDIGKLEVSIPPTLHPPVQHKISTNPFLATILTSYSGLGARTLKTFSIIFVIGDDIRLIRYPSAIYTYSYDNNGRQDCDGFRSVHVLVFASSSSSITSLHESFQLNPVQCFMQPRISCFPVPTKLARAGMVGMDG